MNKWTKILLIVAAVLLLWGLFVPPQTISLRAEEPRRAIVAMEMMLTGDYISPHINGWPYYNKPPVFNWALVGSFQLFGTFSEWAVRFPSLLAFVIMGVLQFVVTRRYMCNTWGALAAFGVLTSGEILVYGSTQSGEIDLFFSMLIYAQMIALFLGLQKEKFSWWLMTSYGIAAIATLTKGLPAVAFQGMTLAGMAIANRSWRVFFRWENLVGPLLFLALVGAYFYRYNSVQGDGWIYAVNLFKEAAQRTGLESESGSMLISVLTFPLRFAKLLFPWSLLLPLVFIPKVRSVIWNNPWLKFCAVFLLSNVALYWFTAELRLRYIYMFVPFAITLTVAGARELPGQILTTLISWLGVVLIAGVTAFAIVAPFIPALSEFDHLWHFTIFGLLYGSFFLWARFKSNAHWTIWPIVAMAFFKFNVNFLYYDSLNASHDDIQRYVNDIPRVMEAADGQHVHLYGRAPHHFKRDASIGPYKMEEVELQTAMLLAYQIPYYITRYQNEVLDFQTEMKPGELYVMREREIRKLDVDILETFFDDWVKCDMVLVRAN